MGTKNDPGVFDCYANAEPDEPMFVLLGRDKHAPTLVWLWAVLRELDGENEAKVAEARTCASHMISWAHDHKRPVVGLGQSTLAGLMELIRAVNTASHQIGADMKNQMTDVDVMRMFLAETVFEPAPAKTES